MTTKHPRRGRSELDPDHPAEAIEDEHRSLRERLDVVATATTSAALLAGLAALPKVLGEHFAAEERVDGLYDDLQIRRPAMGDVLDTLRGEHQVILEELDALRSRVKGPTGVEGRSDKIGEPTAKDVADWLERLRRHEHDESSMIGEVYYTDEGGFG